MSDLQSCLSEACAAIGINVPKKVTPGRWSATAVVGKRSSNTSGRVLIFDDQTGGICHNWATGQQRIFRTDGDNVAHAPQRHQRDPDRERREAEERVQVEQYCTRLVRACRQDQHPYLAAKGFPDEMALVHDEPRELLPAGRLGEAMERAMLPSGEPMLIVPGRVGGKITTVQFIAPDGGKKNVFRGRMNGAAHRIATGRLTVVCEGIATALSVRAALRLLGVSATVLSAFSAANVAKVARSIGGAVIAADHDKPIESLGGVGTGEFYARASECHWLMPLEIGDWNDHHQAHGLRDVALRIREVIPP